MLAHELCQLGYWAIESPHHIFVDYPIFQNFRDETVKEILKFLGLQAAAASFLTDCNITWPLTITQFYLGHIPPLKHYIHRASFSSTLIHNQIMCNIYFA
ncbi:hypothetical protein ARMGADRAFT_931694 [Armillaria gallica]|uniref:Uncharacterized protein n=1 Tax=Armillaria gallica TaxID=47427 RepID=A0A2H3DX31_ARMGA|nr:hypothetical protein ARMGADRAFT_931694 [Armillaria gallica]